MTPLPLPPPHADFAQLSKQALLQLADALPSGDPWVVDRCVAFVCAETGGLWHGRARAKLCRRLKHLELGRTHRDQLRACILSRLEHGRFSEQFKDQLRLAIRLWPGEVQAACRRGLASTRPHVRRYSAWVLGLPSFVHLSAKAPPRLIG